MSDINITEARELFERTTQGKWKSRKFEDYQNDTVVEPEMTFADWVFCCYAHNNWQAMLETIERQRSELGEYWRAACAIESEDDVVSAKGLADLHDIRTGNSYSQVGPSVAEMLVRQRDELAKEIERLTCMINSQQQPVNERLIEASKLGLRWIEVDERNYGAPTATGTALRAAIEDAENELNLMRVLGGAK